MNPPVRLLSLSPLAEAVAPAQDLAGGDWRGGRMQTRAAETLSCAPPAGGSWTEAERRFFAGSSAPDQPRPYQVQGGYLAWLNHARIAASWIVVSARNELIRDSFSGDAVLVHGNRFLPRRMAVQLPEGRTELPFVLEQGVEQERHHDGEAVLIAQHWHSNYHHWLVECLPRLRSALENPSLAAASLLVPQSLSAYQRDSLTLLGVPPTRLLGYDGRSLGVQRLWWPSEGRFAREELHWLRLRARAAVGAGVAPGRRRLYVSRADAPTRRLLNESELMPQLQRAGFERLELGARPFEEQVRCFADAAVILGPHGAGLTNQLFAPPGTIIAELMPDTEPNLCFHLLARQLDQRYTYAVGQSHSANGDFRLPAQRLDALLRDVEVLS